MPPPHHRHSHRFAGYDYSQAGAYYVTLCVHHRLPLFGHLDGSDLILSSAGIAIQDLWDRLPTVLEGVSLDMRLVMHNHIHGIVVLEAGTVSLSRVVQTVKSMTTTAYAHGVRDAQWPKCHGILWQRGYYDHVIRDDEDLNRIRAYIEQNPMRTAMRVGNAPA
jgi:REP element-mobilizing transposase RayT